MMLQALASMMGITPEKLNEEMEGFQNLAKNSAAALSRIERNTQENGRMLRAVCAKLEIEVPHDGSDDHAGRGPGTDDPG